MLLTVGILMGAWSYMTQLEDLQKQMAVLGQNEASWTASRSRRLAESDRLNAMIQYKAHEIESANRHINYIDGQLKRLAALRLEMVQWEDRLPRFQSATGEWYQMNSWPPRIDPSEPRIYVQVRPVPQP